MQGIGIGISDFKVLRLRNNYFIDKSMYIKDVIDNKGDEKTIEDKRNEQELIEREFTNITKMVYVFNGKEVKWKFSKNKKLKKWKFYENSCKKGKKLIYLLGICNKYIFLFLRRSLKWVKKIKKT